MQPIQAHFNGIMHVSYIDTTSTLPGMIELIEIDDSVRVGFANMYRIVREWNRQTLIVYN